MAHQRCFPCDAYAVCNLFSAVEHILESGGNHVHMVIGIYSSRDSQTEQVQSAETVFTGYGVAVGKDVAYFASSDTGFEVELYGKSLCGELFFRNSCKDFACVNEDGMSAGRWSIMQCRCRARLWAMRPP